MLASKYRFHRRNQVNRVYKQGKSVRGGAIALKYRLVQDSGDIRVAVVVSKKVHKSAVKRNRIRRRVFEVIRTNFDELKPGFEGVFTVFDETAATMKHKELKKLILSLLSKAK